LSPSLAYIAVFLPYFFLERPSNLLKNLFSIICSFLLLIRFSMNILSWKDLCIACYVFHSFYAWWA